MLSDKRTINRENYFILRDDPFVEELQKLPFHHGTKRPHATCTISTTLAIPSESAPLDTKPKNAAPPGEPVITSQNPVSYPHVSSSNGGRPELFGVPTVGTSAIPVREAAHFPPRSSTWQRGDATFWASRLHSDSRAEGLQRRLIELERENGLLRLAFLEGSERRTRQRFHVRCVNPTAAFGLKGGDDISSQLAQRMREVERDTKAHLTEALRRLEASHSTARPSPPESAASRVGGDGALASFESILAEAERRRWRTHVKDALAEVAMLRRERERRAGDAEGRCATSEGGEERTHALEKEVQHWKSVAEAEKGRAERYRSEAMLELRRMHAVYQETLGGKQLHEEQGHKPHRHVSVASSFLSNPELEERERRGVGKTFHKETSLPSVQFETIPLSRHDTDLSTETNVYTTGDAHVTDSNANNQSDMRSSSVASAFPVDAINNTLETHVKERVRHTMGNPVSAMKTPGASLSPQNRRTYHSEGFLRGISVVTNDSSFNF